MQSCSRPFSLTRHNNRRFRVVFRRFRPLSDAFNDGLNFAKIDNFPAVIASAKINPLVSEINLKVGVQE